MILSKARAFSALILCATSILSACGSDSTGPGDVDSNAALQSLSLGLQGFSGAGSPTTPAINGSLGAIAPLLGQVTVNIDGVPQGMFALGVRMTFPPGTCEENLFVGTLPPEPGACTSPELGLLVLLWQAHSARRPPDRMIIIVADEGTTNFDFESAALDVIPGLALYVEGTTNLWSSISGTLATQVTGSSQTCTMQLPPYVKSATCNIATFNEQGSIVFEPFSANAPTTQRTTLVIPSSSVHGLWLAITEVQPTPLTMNRLGAALRLPAEALSPQFLAAKIRSARLTPAR
jgi:hypothetical protein